MSSNDLNMEINGMPLGLLYEYRKKVEAMHPLVHCITNTITIWDCANILLAAGASPTMAHHPEEVAEITSGCQALDCNLGAMDDFQAMLNAAPAAAKLGHPIVVDPVGCGGSTFRRNKFKELTKAAQISCVRGNASEIRALAEGVQTVTGVDAGEDDLQAANTVNAEKKNPQAVTGVDAGDKDAQAAPPVDASVEEFLPEKHPESDLVPQLPVVPHAIKLARKLHCIVIASGAIDVVTDGSRVFYIKAGDPLMSKITGSGCMSTALLGAYLAAENSLESAAACCTTMGICGERAAAKTRAEGGGTMTFHNHLIDEMSLFGGTVL